jgi:type IV pilus assembly protein PilB
MVVKNTLKSKKLGDLLVEVGLLTADQLKRAVEAQKEKGGRLGDVLVEMKLLSREVMLSFLGKRCGVPFVSLSEYGAPSPEAVAMIPEAVARRQSVLPLRRKDGELTVAMADPLNVFATDDLKVLAGCEVKVVIAAEAEIKAGIDAAYGGDCAMPSVEGQVRFDSPDADAPAINLLNVLLDNAARAGASSVHLEPGEGSIKVRYRVGEKLSPRPEISGKFQEGLAARVKDLAHMNPLETWAPQEGHIRAKVSGRELDIRVSTLPTFYGEKIVLRFLDNSKPELDLGKLGFGPADLSAYRKALEVPGGLVLVVGPAGAGKTVTFCASLLHLARPEKHVATMEDPVERFLPGVNQVQARPHVGLTVASGVRSLLRQDPDVIGVGEFRQPDEARAALEAVQAGVPVIAALRAPTAESAVSRMLEAGVPREALASALKAVVVQRWARALCTSCRESHSLPCQTLADMGFSEDVLKALQASGTVTLFRSKGCGACGQTGVRDRTLLASVIVVDAGLRARLREGSPDVFSSFPMKVAALRKALEGAISLDEALR